MMNSSEVLSSTLGQPAEEIFPESLAELWKTIFDIAKSGKRVRLYRHTDISAIFSIEQFDGQQAEQLSEQILNFDRLVKQIPAIETIRANYSRDLLTNDQPLDDTDSPCLDSHYPGLPLTKWDDELYCQTLSAEGALQLTIAYMLLPNSRVTFAPADQDLLCDLLEDWDKITNHYFELIGFDAECANPQTGCHFLEYYYIEDSISK